jgi:hypothetical protein
VLRIPSPDLIKTGDRDLGPLDDVDRSGWIRSSDDRDVPTLPPPPCTKRRARGVSTCRLSISIGDQASLLRGELCVSNVELAQSRESIEQLARFAI